MVQRFVGDTNSTIGMLIRRGSAVSVPSPLPPPLPALSSPPPTPLDIFEEALAEAAATKGVIPQVVPQAIDEAVRAAEPVVPPPPTTTNKEAAESVSLDQVALDAARGAQVVESEPTPEISPEVESYLQKVEENKDIAPPEIVIADGSQTTPTNHRYPSQPVVVLPITPEIEQQGVKKSPAFSIRWLVEWSRKLMKVFSGKVIYRPLEGGVAP